MGINVSSLTPSQAQKYYYDYNNGNKSGLSEAEYASLCTKFRDYIAAWDKDENSYSTPESPGERLNYDADDAGFLSEDGKAVQGVANAGVAVVGAGVTSGLIFKETASNLTFKVGGNTGLGKGLEKGAKGNVEGALLIVAALQLTMALATKANSPNKDAVEACANAQEELYVEQAMLAEQVLQMEEMQEEMIVLQEEAVALNEKGQADITSMEGLYNYYYLKYQNGSATASDIAKLNSLSVQMQSTQTATTEETGGLNEEIAAVGENYEVVSDNIENTNNFTEYVSEIDEATRTAAIVQGSILALSAASAAFTSIKCAAKASSLAGSIIGSWAAVLYVAAAVAAGLAAAMFGTESAKQFTSYRSTAQDTIDIRRDTQDLSTETTEFQEVSTEFWEETVEATSTDNLFTLTPTYAMQTISPTSGQSETIDGAATRTATSGSTGGTTGGTATGGTTTGGSTSITATSEDDKKEDK